MPPISIAYIAAGGNRHPSAADWSAGLLAFGAGNNVALWDPNDAAQPGISSLLTGHTDTVRAIKVLDLNERRLIISGSSDGTVRLWTATQQPPGGYHQVQCLTDHGAAINAIAILPQCSTLATGAADGTVKIWSLSDTTAKLTQSISLKAQCLPLTLALTFLPSGNVVLAVAGTTSSIQLYFRHRIDYEFVLQATLTGHEGWIRSLDFTAESNDSNADILLASASQDKYIRLWRVHQGRKGDAPAAGQVTDVATEVKKKSLSNKAHRLGSSDVKYDVTFEALLVGHEDWIYTVRWGPKSHSEAASTLLSASADNSLAIWRVDPACGLWVCSTRLGEISSQKGSTTATGSTGGFWIGLWEQNRASVVSLGGTGSWRRWAWDCATGTWLQQVGISGHVGEVRSLAWSPSGNYILTTSSDQTTRLLAQWRGEGRSSWHELTRPQIHGYDLNCISTITENQFVSGADEKMLRVFNKPKAVDNLLSRLGDVSSSVGKDLPDSASLPVLGLSNKAIAAVNDEDSASAPANGDTGEHEAMDPAFAIYKSTLDLQQPPFEDHLARHTLWPEHEKLYGHGYEISAVASSHDGSIIATACKASTLDHAVIRMYDAKEWREIKPPLSAHNLTVTSLAFSSDDRYLLSVGRDRQWAVFERGNGTASAYFLRNSNPNGHSRMILDCGWLPARGAYAFATAGRDRTAKLWKLQDGKAECVEAIAMTGPVTALAAAQNSMSILVALGLEDGRISILELDPATLAVQKRTDLDQTLTPSRTVNCLRWRPELYDDAGTSAKTGQLAIGSDDYSVRILNIS